MYSNLRFETGQWALKMTMWVRCLSFIFAFGTTLVADEPPLSTSPELASVESPPASLPLEDLVAAAKKPVMTSGNSSEGYTINYNTVSILEYLRFASKICNTNFIFNDADLDFTVTVVSDAPITPENVMSTLVQVLRVHGLELLEQDNNLVIHKTAEVRQVATLVTESGQGGKAAIVTRIFRIKHIKTESIAAIIRPMISGSALLETENETRQLILTDVRTNVDKVASLIEILDSPAAPVEMGSYGVLHNNPENLTAVATQIMAPMTQGNPFSLVVNPMTNEIYVVSTHDLVQKALSILQTLDVPPKEAAIQAKRLKSENVFIYKPVYRNGKDLLTGLQEVASNLEKAGVTEGDFISTLSSARWIPEANSILFVGSKEGLDKAKELLSNLDVKSKMVGEETNFFVYRPQNKSASELLKSIEEMAKNLKDSKISDKQLLSTLANAKLNESANSLTFSGDESTFASVKEILSLLDVKGSARLGGGRQSFYLFKPQHTTASQIELSLKDFASSLDKSKAADSGLLDTIHQAQVISSTNTILFTGAESDLKRLQDIVATFDVAQSGGQFLVYKPKAVKGDQLAIMVKELIDELQASQAVDPQLLRTLQSMKYVKSTHSLLFTGDSNSIKKAEELISDLDSAANLKGEKKFILYEPKYVSKENIEAYVRQLSENLTKKGGSDDLVAALRSLKWIDASHSFMIYGSESTLTHIQGLLQNFDTENNAAKGNPSFFLYKPQHISASGLQKSLKDVADKMKKGGLADPELLRSIDTVNYVEESRSFLFTGTPDTLQKVQAILKDLDTQGAVKSGYSIYKVQHTTGDLIEEDLDNLAKNFASSGIKDAKVLDVIHNIRYVKETNSLLLTGDPKAIEETKALIEQYDYPRGASRGASNFFMYKPQHLPATDIQKSLADVAENLKKANLADPALLQSIQTAKYVETTNSLIFTGTQDTLQKIQGLLKEIDLPSTAHAPIQKIGQTTFLLYKLKHASGGSIQNSLQNITNDLKKSHTSDKEFLSALTSMKYIRETNSLLFTGDEESLKKVEALVERFDLPGLAGGAPSPTLTAGGPSDYFIYKPQAVPGPELEQTLKDFGDHLKQNNLNDPDLFTAIDTSRWVEKTQSIVFTGSPKALERVKELLKTFDIPGNVAVSPNQEPSIQAIDNTSFLVYKLQFHRGDEIQGALRQIAVDLTKANAPINQNLLNSINSIQWLEMTNSLLCSGDNETLTRLRELVKNLDIPLKQVFIEILVIETTLTNALNFGLEWGSNFNFRNQYSGSTFNTAPGSALSTAPSIFDTNLSKLAPPSTPAPQLIPPPAGGFDLGVIGEVIKHNGITYLTLGSLLTALQTDAETSIVMTPKIIAQDGRQASLFQGNNVPFSGSFVSNTQQGGTVQTANIEYRDIGMQLTVTPVLGNSDIVTLDINFNQSQITGSSAGTINVGGASVSSGLTTSKTNMQTTVHVPDKHFLILTGNVNNSNVKSKSGIPCLGGLPLIGAAFSQTSDTINTTNIVVFLRPHILSSKDDMNQISKEQEEYFRDQSGTPFLQHNYDESMDLIKSINDE